MYDGGQQQYGEQQQYGGMQQQQHQAPPVQPYIPYADVYQKNRSSQQPTSSNALAPVAAGAAAGAYAGSSPSRRSEDYDRDRRRPRYDSADDYSDYSDEDDYDRRDRRRSHHRGRDKRRTQSQGAGSTAPPARSKSRAGDMKRKVQERLQKMGFEEKDMGLAASAAGALAGGFLGNRAGKGDIMSTIIGAAAGGFGANALEKRHEK